MYKDYKMKQRKGDDKKLNEDDKEKMSLIDAALHEHFPIFINIAPPKTKEQSKGLGL